MICVLLPHFSMNAIMADSLSEFVSIKHLSNLLLSNKQRGCRLICFFGYGKIQKSHLAHRFYSRIAVHQTNCAVKAVYPRRYPTILLPRCEHSGGKSAVDQAIIGHGIGLITCPLIFREPRSKMTIDFVPQQGTGLKQGYQSEKTCTDQILVCKIREETRYRPSYYRALLDLISCKLPNAM